MSEEILKKVKERIRYYKSFQKFVVMKYARESPSRSFIEGVITGLSLALIIIDAEEFFYKKEKE